MTVAVLATVADWLRVRVLPAIAVTVVPAGIPAPTIREPTVAPAELATVSVGELVVAAAAVEFVPMRTRTPLM